MGTIDYDALIEERGTGVARATLRSRTRALTDAAANLETLRELAAREAEARADEQPPPASVAPAAPDAAERKP